MNCTVWYCNKCGKQNFILDIKCKKCGIPYAESSDLYIKKIKKSKKSMKLNEIDLKLLSALITAIIILVSLSYIIYIFR